MAGLVPAIHVLLSKEVLYARDISAFTRVFDALCAGMTLRGWCKPTSECSHSNGWMRTTWPSWSVYQTVTGSVELSIQDCRSRP